MKNLKTLFFALTGVLLLFGSGNVWGGTTPTVLFHETFGNNTGSARNWSDDYSVKSGVAAVYSGITSYTVSNVKQGKNTTGSTQSGLNQSTAGTDAYIIFGPLNVKNYNTLSVTYQWKAASVKGTYSTTLYYATSLKGSYTEVSGTGNGAVGFVTRSYSLPAATQVATLYLKVVFNTSNTQAIIDEFELKGVAASSGYDITYECNEATSGCPEKATDQTALPDPLPTGVEKTGFDFAGWFTDEGLTTAAEAGATILANTTLYAKWSAKLYEVTLDKNEHATDNGGMYIYYNGVIDSEYFSAVSGIDSNYDLLGYYTATSGGDKVVNANGTLVSDVAGWTTSDGKWAKDADDVALYAQYEPVCTSSITITKGLESHGTFTLSPTGSVCIDGGNATANITNITPDTHYHFGEITTSASGSVDNVNKQVTNISASTTINVTFEEDAKYTVTFSDAVHGTDCSSYTMTNKYAGTQIVFNSIADKTPASPTGDCVNDHYHFVGWVESGVEPTENPSNVIAAGTTSINVTKTVTYKAVWAQEKTE